MAVVDIKSEVVKGSAIRRHIINMLSPLLLSLAMLLPLIIVLTLVTAFGYTTEQLVRAGLWLFSGLYLIFVTSFFMMQWIFWYLDVWFITQHRLIDSQLLTLFNRRTAQIPFAQVQDVRITIQGYFASLFRFGDITVQSAGKEGFFQMRSIPNARDVADHISELSEIRREEKTSRPVAGQVARPSQRLGETLVTQGTLSRDDLVSVLQDQHQSGKRLGQLLLERNLISREDLVYALGNQYRMPSIDLSRYQLESEVVHEMPYEVAAKYTAIPVSRSPESLTIAIAEPSPEKIGELAAQFDIPLAFMVADEDYIKEAITGHYLVHGDGVGVTPRAGGGGTQQVKDVLPE